MQEGFFKTVYTLVNWERSYSFAADEWSQQELVIMVSCIFLASSCPEDGSWPCGTCGLVELNVGTPSGGDSVKN